MFGLCVTTMMLVPADGIVPAILRKAAPRRLFSIGATTSPPLGVVSGGSHVAEIHQRARFDRPLEKAGVNLADRDLKFTHRLSDRFC
jgi:hypothetical protein